MDREKHSIQEYADILWENGLVCTAYISEEAAKVEISYLSYDSQDMESGGLFICKGAHFIPEYLADAIDRGAVCYVSETDYPETGLSFPRIIVTDIRKAMALLGNLYYDAAWKELRLIGITGTKGKSTTTYYVKYILDHYLTTLKKPMSAVLSGIDVYDGIIFEESHLTTPEAVMLHRHFRNAVDSGIEYLEMEVSSQALKYDRTMGLTFDVGCFLNIGEDHISPIEHIDFDDYFASKLMLMEQCRTACINISTDHGQEVREAAAGKTEVLTFGTDPEADIYGSNITSKDGHITFDVRTPKYAKEFSLAMPGLFNVENALAAIAICYSLDIPADSIWHGLSQAKVAGRMEIFVGEKSKTIVVVDYAHNKLSFDRLFSSTAKEYPEHRIFAVFGCPGKKALTRRRELALIAGEYSEKIFITEEDAGEESVMEISWEIAENVKETGCPFEIIGDRGEAIRKAIEEADDRTIILLTGKGRETRQKRGTQYIDCISDVEYVDMYLK